jgi:hypothetical protein
MGGHGVSTVRLSAGEMSTEFVYIPRASAPEPRRDGGPRRYRVAHRAPLWRAGERLWLEQDVVGMRGFRSEALVVRPPGGRSSCRQATADLGG